MVDGPVITGSKDTGGWDGFAHMVAKLPGLLVRVTNPGQAPVEVLVESTTLNTVSGPTWNAKTQEWDGPRILRLELDDDVLIEVH